MDKAIKKIEWLQDVFVTRKEQQHFNVNVTIKNSFAEAIAELQAYKAKVEELKECCKTQILLNDEKFKVYCSDKHILLSKSNEGATTRTMNVIKATGYSDILQKLEELGI